MKPHPSFEPSLPAMKRAGEGAICRRDFLAGLGALAGMHSLASAAPAEAASSLDAGTNAAGIPLRRLGRTGEKVTIIGLGTAPVGHSMPGPDKGVPVYRAALEAGINYVDTAHGYDDAEGYLGELVPAYRERIFLVTKALPSGATPDAAAKSMQQQFEMSLRKMKTDHVDLLHIHSIGNAAPELVLGAGGALDFARKMKERGTTRFIGITSHCRHARTIEILQTGAIDVIMVVLNFVDYHTYAFEQEVLPLARQQGCGIVAMKVFGGHRYGFAGYKKPGPSKMPSELLQNALRYSLGIEGVSTAVVGAYNAEEILQDIEWARQHRPFSPEEQARRREQGRALARDWGTRLGPVA